MTCVRSLGGLSSFEAIHIGQEALVSGRNETHYGDRTVRGDGLATAGNASVEGLAVESSSSTLLDRHC